MYAATEPSLFIHLTVPRSAMVFPSWKASTECFRAVSVRTVLYILLSLLFQFTFESVK